MASNAPTTAAPPTGLTDKICQRPRPLPRISLLLGGQQYAEPHGSYRVRNRSSSARNVLLLGKSRRVWRRPQVPGPPAGQAGWIVGRRPGGENGSDCVEDRSGVLYPRWRVAPRRGE